MTLKTSRLGCGDGSGRHRSTLAVGRNNHIHLTTDEISSQGRQPLVLIVSMKILDEDVLAFDVAAFAQPLAKRRHPLLFDHGWGCDQYPDAPHPLTLLRPRREGQAAAAPPSRVTNSRRLMPGMGSLPGAAAYHISWNRRVQAVWRIRSLPGEGSAGLWGKT